MPFHKLCFGHVFPMLGTEMCVCIGNIGDWYRWSHPDEPFLMTWPKPLLKSEVKKYEIHQRLETYVI